MGSLNSTYLFMVLSLLLLITLSNLAQADGAAMNPSECKPRCTYRCSATSHKNRCMSYCLKCCSRCLCVPPGTYGNKQQCPCYNNLKTREGGPMCP